MTTRKAEFRPRCTSSIAVTPVRRKDKPLRPGPTGVGLPDRGRASQSIMWQLAAGRLGGCLGDWTEAMAFRCYRASSTSFSVCRSFLSCRSAARF
jgi:hypothetical protein